MGVCVCFCVCLRRLGLGSDRVRVCERYIHYWPGWTTLRATITTITQQSRNVLKYGKSLNFLYFGAFNNAITCLYGVSVLLAGKQPIVSRNQPPDSHLESASCKYWANEWHRAFWSPQHPHPIMTRLCSASDWRSCLLFSNSTHVTVTLTERWTLANQIRWGGGRMKVGPVRIQLSSHKRFCPRCK